jgi:hypothetical protein
MFEKIVTGLIFRNCHAGFKSAYPEKCYTNYHKRRTSTAQEKCTLLKCKKKNKIKFVLHLAACGSKSTLFWELCMLRSLKEGKEKRAIQ